MASAIRKHEPKKQQMFTILTFKYRNWQNHFEKLELE
jgi:hypothetical protein